MSRPEGAASAAVRTALARGPRRIAEIAEATGYSRVTVSRALGRMEAAGEATYWRESRSKVWCFVADLPEGQPLTPDDRIAAVVTARERATIRELRAVTGMPQSSINHALSRLQAAGRVRRSRGRWRPK